MPALCVYLSCSGSGFERLDVPDLPLTLEVGFGVLLLGRVEPMQCDGQRSTPFNRFGIDGMEMIFCSEI